MGIFHVFQTVQMAQTGQRVSHTRPKFRETRMKCMEHFQEFLTHSFCTELFAMLKPATLLKETLLHECFSRFYLIAQMVPNRAKRLI